MCKAKKYGGTRPLRRAKTLRAAAKHVSYEIGMLSAAGLRLPYGFSSPAEDDTANMALESFLLHFRNLRAFLCPSLQKPRRDDVIASDFLGSPKAEDQANPKVLGRRKRKIDKLLAHISYSREGYVRRGAKSWPGPRMLGDVRAALRQFLDRLPPERRDWFIKDLQVQEAMSAPEGKASAETGCTSTVVTTDLVEFLGFGLVAGQDDQ